MYLSQSLRGDGPSIDQHTGALHFDYTVTDRRVLDLGMQELALGLRLPFISHRGPLLQAQLAALPPVTDYQTLIQEFSVQANVIFPEYSIARNFARVNGYYLSLLLAEGKRAQAEPFLHTGDYLVVQMADDTPMTLIGQLVALAIGVICERDDARVCRQFGYPREAAMIEAHQDLLIGKLREWKTHGRLLNKPQLDALIATHGGILPAILLPTFGSQPPGLITRATLRPSRLSEYTFIEGAHAAAMSLFACLLLVYAGLKYWRWKLATRGEEQPAPEVALSAAIGGASWGTGCWRRWRSTCSTSPTPPGPGAIMAFSSPDFASASAWRSSPVWALIVPAALAAGTLRRQEPGHRLARR